ncbi:MAG: TauD/TfdA family dioxygenase, partial [Pseudomonadota bacterium]
AAAYKHLPAALKAEIEGTQVVHTGAPYGSANAPPLDTQFTGSMRVARNNPEADAEIVHPTVRRHPESGEPALFLNPTYTTRFAHQSNAASAELLGKLFAHCTRPEFTCRFRWTPNCVAIWDNRNTLHYAVNDYDGHRRVMYRTTIAGDTPLSWA